jgi:hypothetical protein
MTDFRQVDDDSISTLDSRYDALFHGAASARLHAAT